MSLRVSQPSSWLLPSVTLFASAYITFVLLATEKRHNISASRVQDLGGTFSTPNRESSHSSTAARDLQSKWDVGDADHEVQQLRRELASFGDVRNAHQQVSDKAPIESGVQGQLIHGSLDPEFVQLRDDVLDIHDTVTDRGPARDSLSSSTIPFPNGVASEKIFGGSKPAAGKIPPECITIVQISNHIDWDGVNGEQLADIAVEDPNKVSKILGIIQMYLYAKRHGHGYRVVKFEGKSVKMGSGRPDRHPAWSRVPLLWLLYNGGTGSDVMLENTLGETSCSAEDRWMLYLDTDVVVTATGFNVAEILESLRKGKQYKPGLPCWEVYNDSSFASPQVIKAAGANASFCHHFSRKLSSPLASGVDPHTDVAVAGFNDMYYNTHNCESMRDPSLGRCPNPVKDNMCSAIMLWRLPSPKLGRDKGASFKDAAISRAVAAGKQMVDAWRSSRLAPGKEDPEDFLAMAWSDAHVVREHVVYNPEVNEIKCRTTSCGFAGDQTVFNRAVLYSLPHRPFHVEDQDNNRIGRFIKHIAMFSCEGCVKDNSYNLGEPFFHGTAWKFKRDHLITWMLKLSYELHGLSYIFPYTAGATAGGKPTPLDNGMLARGISPIRHQNQEIESQLKDRLENACHAKEEKGRAHCVVSSELKQSAAVVNTAIHDIKSLCEVSMRLNPKFRGIDDSDQSVDWYQVFKT